MIMLRITLLRSLHAIILCLLTVSLIILHAKCNQKQRSYDAVSLKSTSHAVRPSHLDGRSCSSTGGTPNITIVLKTGEGEILKLSLEYLNRLGRCQNNLLIFSDKKNRFDGHVIHDALANLPTTYHSTEAFSTYNTLQQRPHKSLNSSQGWKLDKFKFLPIMELTWQNQPESDWYIFIELDTYVNWDNMFLFLSRFNPRRPYYFGSPVWPKWKDTFAHGGTGIVLSNLAIERLNDYGKTFEDYTIPGSHQFGIDIDKECCGDEVLANVLKKIGIRLHGYWPMFDGESPNTVRFGEDHWCEAIITLHHVGMEEADSFHQWQLSRPSPSIPLTFEEAFNHIEPKLQYRLDDWSNMSEDIIHEQHKSFEQCHSTCLKDRKCFQFEHFGETCRLSYSIRLGRSQYESESRRTSGWMLDRINEFKRSHSPCDHAHLVHSNP